MALYKLVRQAAKFSEDLIGKQLPANMHFHNLQHTRYVVNAVTHIGSKCKISEHEMAIVQIAAWFHDTGYCYAYYGHEDNSVAIASTFLANEYHDNSIISTVTDCIAATKMPQAPQTLLQQIMCDADMLHLADEAYITYADKLRAEWADKLNKKYTDTQWSELNLNMLVHHRYFTEYGKTVLQSQKLINIDKLLSA